MCVYHLNPYQNRLWLLQTDFTLYHPPPSLVDMATICKCMILSECEKLLVALRVKCECWGDIHLWRVPCVFPLECTGYDSLNWIIKLVYTRKCAYVLFKEDILIQNHKMTIILVNVCNFINVISQIYRGFSIGKKLVALSFKPLLL